MVKARTIVLALALLATMTAGAQAEKGTWSVTPQVGGNIWWAKYGDTDKTIGLTAGAELGYQLTNVVSLALGADYTLQQFDEKDTGAAISTGRLCLPLLAGVQVCRGLSLRTGIQCGITLHTNKAEWEQKGVFPNVYTGYVKYNFDDVHWYLPVSLTYEYQRLVVDLRYYYSLKKNHYEVVRGATLGALGQYNIETNRHDSMLQLTVGYRLPL